MKHTNLYNEIEIHEPDTSWHPVAVAVSTIIAATFIIFAVGTLMVDVMMLVK